MDSSSKIEPISAFHKDCPHCGSSLFPVSNQTEENNDGEEKPDKECHCCGKKIYYIIWMLNYALCKC